MSLGFLKSGQTGWGRTPVLWPTSTSALAETHATVGGRVWTPAAGLESCPTLTDETCQNYVTLG